MLYVLCRLSLVACLLSLVVLFFVLCYLKIYDSQRGYIKKTMSELNKHDISQILKRGMSGMTDNPPYINFTL